MITEEEERVGTSSHDFVDNVDIMYSIVGRQKPPQVPLREELMTNGNELVYNAKGIGEKAVNAEQKLREAQLLKKLKLIEQKLHRNLSYKLRGKRKKAFDTVKKLRQEMERGAIGISYEEYEKYLKERNEIESMPHTSTRSLEVIEERLMEALELLDDEPYELELLDDPELAFTGGLDTESDLISEGTTQQPIDTRDTRTENTVVTLERRESPSITQPIRDKHSIESTFEDKASNRTDDNCELLMSGEAELERIEQTPLTAVPKYRNIENTRVEGEKENLLTSPFESYNSLSAAKNPSPVQCEMPIDHSIAIHTSGTATLTTVIGSSESLSVLPASSNDLLPNELRAEVFLFMVCIIVMMVFLLDLFIYHWPSD